MNVFNVPASNIFESLRRLCHFALAELVSQRMLGEAPETRQNFNYSVHTMFNEQQHRSITGTPDTVKVSGWH